MPYTFRSVIRDGNKYPEITVKTKQDLLDYTWEIYKESSLFIKEHHSKDSADYTVFQQIPFFACFNYFIEPIYQKDISRYIYSQETGTQPYAGDYGEQPGIWVEKFFIIKKTLADMTNTSRRKQLKKQKHGS